ncbi:MAG TPA: IS630 family transposase [Nitrososphaeraceae archaeon]|nr:IS630 family transposase [Nitrososphaeraceae archaeon]
MSINTVLNSAYKKEKDTNIKERILLVKRIKIDKQEAASVAENELNRSRWWAYKWLHRFDKDGLYGLKDKERSGRPPDVPKEVMIKIQKKLADSNTGWDFRQVMDLIYKKTGVRYHEVHIYRLLHRWGFKPKVPQKKICKYCIREGEKEIQKRVKQILASLKSDWNVIVQDEFIFVHDYVIRRKKWISENKRPVVIVTAGSRKKTIVFGSLSLDGKQLFKQYDEFNSKTFVDYLKHIQKRLEKSSYLLIEQLLIIPKLPESFLMQIKISLD